MSETTRTTTQEASKVSSHSSGAFSYFNSTPSSSDILDVTLSPLAIGLILEPGIVLVVLGNLLVLLSLRCHRNLIVTDVLLFSLSLADFVDGLLPLQIVIFMNYFIRRPWPKELCDAFTIVVNTLRFASAGTVTLIALERTFLLVFPLKYYTKVTISKTRKIVAFTWFISIFFGILPFAGVGHSGYKDGKCLYQLSALGTEYAIVIIAVAFIMLFTVMSCYVAIKLSSLKFIKRQSDMVAKLANDASKLVLVMGMGKHGNKTKGYKPATTKTQGVKEVRRLTVMMAVVILLYYISWLPILINSIVSLIRGKEPDRAVVLFTGMLSLLYALSNPILYGKLSHRYRRGYQHVAGGVLGLCGCRPASWKTLSTSQTTVAGVNTITRRTVSQRGSESNATPTNGKDRRSMSQQGTTVNATVHALNGYAHTTDQDDSGAWCNGAFEHDSQLAARKRNGNNKGGTDKDTESADKDTESGTLYDEDREACVCDTYL